MVELNETKIQLEEATDTIEAIRSGEVDALIVKDKEGHQLYTLKSADQTYRIFIEQMSEGAVTLNEDNIILYCNSQFALMTGLPHEKIIGQSFCNLFSQENSNNCVELILKAWKNNVKGELVMITQSGKVIPVLLSLKTLDLDEGLSMSIIISDLTTQKETQELLKLQNKQLEAAQHVAAQLNANLEDTVKERTKALEKNIQEKIKVENDLLSNQERLTRILETMAEGVVIIDIQGNLTYANPMAQRILGLKQNEISNITYYDSKWQNLRIDGSTLPDKEHPLAVMMSSGIAVYDQEIALQKSDKEIVYISINAAPLHDQSGILIGGVGTFMDVTNRRKIAQQKDEFISVASHELKTPLTTLKASLQLLIKWFNDDPLSEKIPIFIEKANQSLVKVVRLTEDLMNVSKLKQGQLPLDKSWFKLNELIEECCDHVKAGGLHELIFDIDGDLEIFADHQRIDQVLINLINNAVKYAPNSRMIKLSAKKIDEMIKISVQDFGIGIPAEKLPHLFDRYYRVDPSGIQFSGLGLGLYISSEIIERHGGEIGVDSSEGKGSTFWFTLPLNKI